MNERSAEDLPPRIARVMLWTALGLIFLIRLISAEGEGVTPEALVLTMGPYPPLIAILARPRHWRPKVRYALLGAVIALALMPFAAVGTAWNWLPWTIAAGVLCVLPPRVAWPLFGLVMVATTAGGVLAGEPFSDWFWRLSAAAIDGLIIFGLYSLAEMVSSLHTARDELARLAMLRERLRLDGELREVVGGELRTISELLTRADVARAAETARETLAGIRETASEYRAASTTEAAAPIGSPRLARLMLLAVLILQAGKAAVNIGYLPGENPLWVIPAVPLLAAIVTLYMLPPSRFRLALLALLSVPPAWPGGFLVAAWLQLVAMYGFLMGAVLTWMRPPRSWAIIAAMIGLHCVWFYFPPPVPTYPKMASSLISDVILAFVVYSFTRLGELVVLLDRARRDLAQAAVNAERIRIARDLHDVLGFSLSAVALRGELAATLMERDPVRARAETATLIEIVERSRAELASITGGRIRLLLSREVDSALEVLAAAGVDADARVETGTLPVAVDTALAAMLRESVTNVLRHSDARTCTIAITREPGGAVRLSVVNDGAATAAAPRPGSGLKGLAERSGGRLSAGPRPGGCFEMVAEFSDPAGLGGDADGVDPVAGVQLGDR